MDHFIHDQEGERTWEGQLFGGRPHGEERKRERYKNMEIRSKKIKKRRKHVSIASVGFVTVLK